MFSAVTVCLVPELKGGPFVYWDGIANAAEDAKTLGFDALEIFAPDADAIDIPLIEREVIARGLKVAAFGTGAGWALQKLSLTDRRTQAAAEEFIMRIMAKASAFAAPVILGSMQGKWEKNMAFAEGQAMLRDSIAKLANYAAAQGITLLYEPLNRYESNWANTLAQASELLPDNDAGSVKILADLFHMNIEETDSAKALLAVSERIGHVHLADSNRQAAGRGQTNFGPIFDALKQMDFAGALSAEVFSLPDAPTAAKTTIETYKHFSQ
jgi:sugar phosphate isomerase/epimerase